MIDNCEESESVCNQISAIEDTAIQIPIIHLSEAEDDTPKISQGISPQAVEMPEREPLNSNLRVGWEHPNQRDESENDLQAEEAEWDSILPMYPGVYEEKNKLGAVAFWAGLQGTITKVIS